MASGPSERAFSGYPVAPSSPRELVDINAAEIFTVQLTDETRLAAAWGERFRSNQDKKILAILGALKPKPKPAPAPQSPRYPSSAAAARVQYGWMLDPKEHDRLLRAHPKPPAAALDLYKPMSSSPRQKMPPFYGRSMHVFSSTGTDPRAQ